MPFKIVVCLAFFVVVNSATRLKNPTKKINRLLVLLSLWDALYVRKRNWSCITAFQIPFIMIRDKCTLPQVQLLNFTLRRKNRCGCTVRAYFTSSQEYFMPQYLRKCTNYRIFLSAVTIRNHLELRKRIKILQMNPTLELN